MTLRPYAWAEIMQSSATRVILIRVGVTVTVKVTDAVTVTVTSVSKAWTGVRGPLDRTVGMISMKVSLRVVVGPRSGGAWTGVRGPLDSSIEVVSMKVSHCRPDSPLSQVQYAL